MFPWRRILCPTDFSDPSLEGIRTGNEIARHLNGRIILLHVIAPIPGLGSPIHPGPARFDIPGYQRELAEKSRLSLEQIRDNRVADEIVVDIHVVVGRAAEEIVNAARQFEADLIVIATSGMSGWRKWMYGSVTEKVVRHAAVPVLTVTRPSGEPHTKE